MYPSCPFNPEKHCNNSCPLFYDDKSQCAFLSIAKSFNDLLFLLEKIDKSIKK